MKKLTDQQALQLIDGICLGFENSDQSLENAKKCINTIYEVAHSHDKNHSCFSVHNNWREKSVKLFKGYQEIGMC